MSAIIGLFGHPRALSTAFLRMMMERGDFHVLYEPFCNLYAQGRVRLPEPDGREVVIESYAELFKHIYRWADARPVFFKDTTEHRYAAVLEDPDFLRRIVSTFIVRDPRKAIPSHYAVNPRVTLEEIGYEHELELFERARSLGGRPPVVVDADDLASRPEGIVRAYCEAVGIPFVAEALSWRPGERKEWERTNAWHLDVNASAGISRIEKAYAATVDNHEALARYHRYHLPFYERLRAFRLVV